MIGKKFFLLLILIGIPFFSAEVSAFKVAKTSNGAVIKWHGKDTVFFLLNDFNGPTGTPSAISSAFGTWNHVFKCEMSSLTFASAGSTTSTAYGVNDGQNVISFGPLDSPHTVAENVHWFVPSTGAILDSDIRFNTNLSWAADGAGGGYDVWNIAAHELGHSLSLLDLYDPADSEKTMYGYGSSGETRKRTLHQDDIDGICFLYPSSKPSRLKWKLQSNGSAEATPAIGPDGTIYFVGYPNSIRAVSSTGGLKWTYQIVENISPSSSPSIGHDGTIYYTSEAFLHAISPSGQLKWKKGMATQGCTPAIGSDGTIYVVSGSDALHETSSLYAISPSGELKWTLPLMGHGSQPAIDSGGSIYQGVWQCTDPACSGIQFSVHAAGSSGQSRWELSMAQNTGASPSPAIGPDGSIYVGFDSNAFVALEPGGTPKWWHYTDESVVTPAAVGPDGTLYFGTSSKINAINPNGAALWSYQLGDYLGPPAGNEYAAYPSPAVGSDGTIYAASRDGYINALSPTGGLKWRYAAAGSPVIGPDGTIYFCSGDALHAIRSDSAGPANSSWPMHLQNARHTSNVSQESPGAVSISPILMLLLQ